jgi:peptide/nickel transport system permease protein
MSPRKPAKSNIEEFVAPGVLEHGLVAPGLTENELLTGVASEASFDPSDKIESGFRQGARVFAQNKLAMISVFVLGFLVIACFFGQYVWHTNQTSLLAQIGVPQNAAPSLSHPLGTDINGFDELGRILYGGKYSLTLGFLAGLITILIGTVYGMISGYFGGIVDSIMMRILDAALSIPSLFLIIALVAIFGKSTPFLIIVIGTTSWFLTARLIRSDALVIKNLEYSQASISMGATKLHVIRRHVFVNSMGNIVTVGTFSVADSIQLLSALGFLGLGIQLPATDWGTMLNEGTQELFNGYWWEVFPVAILFIIVIVCINFIGDALRDISEVRLRER